jgi:paraquat-inducible protein B
MNKKISPTLIGAFVAGALALVVITVVLLGSGRLFRRSTDFILYFDSSINGLRVGAPVKFRGVEIGAVKDILLQLGPDLEVSRIPVIITIDQKKITRRGGSATSLDDPESVKAAIDRGLRGQLHMESLLTGLLYIELDFVPEAPAEFAHSEENSQPYQEIPTIPTVLEKAQDTASRLIAKFEEIDFHALINSLQKAAAGIEATTNSPALRTSLQSFEKTMPKVEEAVTSIRNVATTLDEKIKGLSGDLQQTSAEARAALKQAGSTMKRAEETISSVRGVIDADSPTFYELTKSLREVSAAARSLRQLANYLERNPRALIFGKPDSKEE